MIGFYSALKDYKTKEFELDLPIIVIIMPNAKSPAIAATAIANIIAVTATTIYAGATFIFQVSANATTITVSTNIATILAVILIEFH